MVDTMKDHVIGRCSASLRGSGTLLGALLDYIPMSSWPTTFVSSSRIARAVDGLGMRAHGSDWWRYACIVGSRPLTRAGKRPGVTACCLSYRSTLAPKERGCELPWHRYLMRASPSIPLR